MSTSLRLLGVAGAVAGAVALSAGPAAAAAPTPDTAAAADWLAAHLTDGDHVVIGGLSYDGTSADALISLAAAGGHDATVAAIDAHLRGDVANYADPTGAAGGPYSGSLAKLSVVAEITSGDPHAYGGTDLLGVLQAHECTAQQVATSTAANDGVCNAVGEFANSFSTTSQAFGVLALQRSPVDADHVTATDAPVTRLLALQCADGSFTGTLLPAGGTCATGEVDSTAYAVQALSLVSGLQAPVASGLAWLRSAQGPDGGFGGAAGVNANSTGLALSAFHLAPRADAAQIAAAEAFLAARQRTDGAITVSAADSSDDAALLATAQALLGAAGRSLADVAPVVPSPTPTPTTSAPGPTPTPTGSSTATATPSDSGSATATASGTTAPTGTDGAGGGELAATGVAAGHLGDEIGLGAGAVGIGALLVWAGARRVRVARHR